MQLKQGLGREMKELIAQARIFWGTKTGCYYYIQTRHKPQAIREKLNVCDLTLEVLFDYMFIL